MKRYIHKLQEKSVYDKSEDEWFIGFDKNSVEEILSEIDNDLFRVATLCDLGLCDEALEEIDKIRDKL